MKPLQIYRPPQRTIVTEMRQFIVDNTRRQNINAFSCATKVTESTLEQKDVTIGPDNPYTLQDVHNIISIQCPHPIKIELTAFGEIPEPEVRSEQVYFDAEIVVEKADAGRLMLVTVRDKDVFTSAPLEAQVMNMRTGETENVSLKPTVEQGVYTGFIQTQNNDAQGTDFDGTLYCRKDDILRIGYDEPYGAEGLSREVTLDKTVTLDFDPAQILAPSIVELGSFLNFRTVGAETQFATVTNVRSGTSKQVLWSAFLPFELGDTDSETGFACEEGDTLTIAIMGRDISGHIAQVVHTVTVGVAAAPVITASTQVDITKPFVVSVQDESAGQQTRSIVFRNTLTGAVFTFPMAETFNHSGIFGYTHESFYHVGLPGQPVTVEYTVGPTTVTKSLELIKPVVDACPAVEAEPDNIGQSTPVILTVKDHFFLNGSFAGTIKLMADTVVRCTLIKA